MTHPKSRGYTIVVSAMTAAVAATAYLMGDGSEAARRQAVIAMIVGAAVLLMRGPVATAWKVLAARSARDTPHQRDPAARRGRREPGDVALKSTEYDRLKQALQDPGARHLPRLLLTGDDAVIAELLPGVVNDRWQVTDEAVLLWSPLGPDGQPDRAWLGQLRKLRAAPVSAVVLVTHGETDLRPQRRGGVALGMGLDRIAKSLRWAAPVFVLDVARIHDLAGDGPTPVIGCELPPRGDAAAVSGALDELRGRLAMLGTEALIGNCHDRFLAQLSQRLDIRGKALADWIFGVNSRPGMAMPIRGVVFTPSPGPLSGGAGWQPAADLPLWRYVGEHARRMGGRRIGLHPVTVFSSIALTAIGLWSAGMLLSGFQNAHSIHAAQQAADATAAAPNTAARLRALLALQHEIARYAPDRDHLASITSRFGLNRDAAIAAALWDRYGKHSRELIVTPIQQDLEDGLADLAQVQAGGLDTQASEWALGGRDNIKTYLMLANPDRIEPDFLKAQLVRHWRTEARITPGEREDLAERLLAFHADHFKSHPDWRITAQPELVAGARRTVLAVIDQRNAQDTLYRQVIDGIGNRYPDQTLASLTTGTDARGLIRANTLVPGAYTRQAYEGDVAEAIERVAKRTQVTSDWVLSDAGAPQATPPADLRAALTARYFADYADHWQRFMNTVQWEPAPTLPAAIDQLKLMADARQSPVIALMTSLEYQGGAGMRADSLSDTLVAKAQDMLGKKPAGPKRAKPDTSGPLGPAFGPISRLLAQDQAGTGDMSLQRFLERATALRLRLQQVSNSPDADAQARQMAQALFQGKASELADTQAYARLIAASLGAEWAGMGEALFVRPIAQATHAALQPAQTSLNAAWRESIAMAWGRSFTGRYPFADTANDASLPELARFLRPDGGLIQGFLAAQLAGVLELQGDQWKPAATGGQAVAFDPAFLDAINRLQRIGVRLLAQGEPRYQFELKPIPVSGLTDTILTLDGQQLHYYNQRETWHAMTWPASRPDSPGTRLQWRTEAAGTNKHYEFTGRWGLVRMLERANVEAIDSATFQITWHGSPDNLASNLPPEPGSLMPRAAMQPAPKDIAYPIRYLMRTELGQGPLELLALRGFVLPSRIFADRAQTAAPRGS
ncbi:ImcF-related family protein [Cupriavidus sp. 2KB_3]|uniref:ImcF-related family protein n=1 Tax=Cupriavidus sp. 2KB_3 TaxID=3232980 RepID=UPI003F932163